MNQQRGEYTPIQISFDLGSPIHREVLFQVLLTMEQEEPEPAFNDGATCCGNTCKPEPPVPIVPDMYDTPEAAAVVGVETFDDHEEERPGDFQDPNG